MSKLANAYHIKVWGGGSNEWKAAGKLNKHKKNYVFFGLRYKRAAEVRVMFNGRGKAGATMREAACSNDFAKRSDIRI